MLVKCQKCGHENQLGAIFCRECGEKLDLNAIDPEKLEKAKTPIGKKIRNVVSIVIFLAVIACAALMFLPVSPCPGVNESVSQSANGKLECCTLDGKLGKKNEVRFTCEELNYLFNSRFLGNEATNAGSSFMIDNVNFAPVGDDEIEVTLYTSLSGKVPVVFTLVGKVGKSGDAANPVAFEIKSAKVGRMPFCRKCSKIIADKYLPLIEDTPEITKAFSKASEVKVDDGELVFKFSK